MRTKSFVEEIPWQDHPTAEGVHIKPLVSQKEDDINVTCMLVLVPKGKEVPEHIHEAQVDILYPLEGKAVMWIDGKGSFSLEPGVVVRVTKGRKHKIEQVTEDLLLYDVFCPALL